MTKISKIINKLFDKKENDLDYWITACSANNKTETKLYKPKHRHYSINVNVVNRTQYK